MRIIFTSLAFFLLTLQLLAQQREISGTLTTRDGSPLPGINIVVKGTSTGTTTDINGYYSLKVAVGETLVFSFIGMKTQEIVVTNDNFRAPSLKKSKANKKQKPSALQPLPRSLYQDTVSGKAPGVSILSDATPSYRPRNPLDPSTIRSIKRTLNGYSIRTDNDPVKRSGLRLQLSTSFGIDRVNKEPSLQNRYAQGQPANGSLSWRGPDQYETFSWGPLISTLEFDGSNYPYDKNGMLVPKGTGNGKNAIAYDPVSFFRTGTTTATELLATHPGPNGSTLTFDIENRGRDAVIPNSSLKRFNISTTIRNFDIADKLRATASISYSNSKGTLLSRGANLSTIVGSTYRTPSTFDNANSLPVDKAYNFPESYEFPDGTKRSHAPSVADNPNGLVSELPDRERLERFAASLHLRYSLLRSVDVIVNGNMDNQWSENRFGIPTGYSGYTPGRYTQRKDYETFANAIITPSYFFQDGNHDLKVSISYQTQYIRRQLSRSDDFGFETYNPGGEAEVMTSLNKTTSRTSHELIFNAYYGYGQWLTLRLGNRNYFSTTTSSSKYQNIFPTGSIGINLGELLSLWPIYDLRVYGSLSRNLHEATLLYSDWAYGSTRMQVENYSTFFETSELFFDSNLHPETERKFETGIKLSGFRAFRFELAYFNNHTENFLAPAWDEKEFRLQNVATIKNYGATITTGYDHDFGAVKWSTNLVWTKYNSLVQEVYNTQGLVPLSGFASAQTVMAVGKPMGAIFGTSYKKNNDGALIIGSDGFPLEDASLTMIGNPIPDWTLGWSCSIHWRQLQLSFLFDFKKGGDVWNGTNAVLDFFGKSSDTGELRNISNYVFEGVDINNNPSIIPVDFASPTKPVSENRWVRYGWDGVGEEYIEDASWIRFNELALTYSLKQYRSNALLKEVIFSLTGHNLFLITPYTGVDPSSTLFGYTAGNGLDLFNTPGTRRYSAQITFKI